jgi:hypothetical protein
VAAGHTAGSRLKPANGSRMVAASSVRPCEPPVSAMNHLDPAAGNAFAPGYVFVAMLLPIGAHLVHEPLPLLAGLRGVLGDDEVVLEVLAVITLDGFASLSVAFLPLVRGHRRDSARRSRRLGCRRSAARSGRVRPCDRQAAPIAAARAGCHGRARMRRLTEHRCQCSKARCTRGGKSLRPRRTACLPTAIRL